MASQQQDAHADRTASTPDAGLTTGIPAPTTGAGAGDLVTNSDDPAVLREMLDRARERLAFYESFDRIIGENIRRSGELMVETVALREQAQAQAAAIAAERASFDATRQADRETYRTLVQTALNEVAATRPIIDGLVERLQAALVSFGEESPAATADIPAKIAPALDTEPTLAVAEVAPSEAVAQSASQAAAEAEAAPRPEQRPTATSGSEEVTEAPVEEDTAAVAAEPTGPHTVEILAHGIQTAAIAIALQRTLRELEKVSAVEAREFANGVLRLKVVVDGRIEPGDLASWLEANEGRIATASPTVMEITLGPAGAN
jgi:hypothetical protein